MGYPGRHNIYKATIRRMVQQALDQQESDFRQQHAGDTEKDLLLYLREQAMKIQHTPWPGEIVGGSLILERLGSWERAVALAQLPVPAGKNHPGEFARVMEETERQKELYRKRKAEKKAQAQKRMIEQESRKKNKI